MIQMIIFGKKLLHVICKSQTLNNMMFSKPLFVLYICNVISFII